MFNKINLQVNTDLAAAIQVLAWFEQLNEPPLADLKIWWQCQTLLQESFTNIVEHAHKNLPSTTPITIEAVRSERLIEIWIWSYGTAFDLDQQLQETPEFEDLIDERGRGLKIMSMLADEMSYEQTSGDRYCLYIKKVI